MTEVNFTARWSVRAALLVTFVAGMSARADASPATTKPPTVQQAAAARGPSAHCAHHAAQAATEPLPGQSLYNLRVPFVDQRGAALGLDAFRGHPVLITMFYASCTTVCPMLIEQVKAIDAALAPAIRAQTRVLLVSLDPDHDSVARLAELASTHGIRDERWHFVRTSESFVRETAALLGIRYRRMPDGSISHASSIALLDREGVVVARVAGGDTDTAQIASAIAR
ncbi:MAG TPA: SCO family protein [Polyangiaceae bacterium]|nr:SCO family protein [Polyangiaceae bacterium]